MSYILGINPYHGDSSAAIIKDGKLIAAVEEERFNRKKHWSGFPTEAIKHWLSACGITAKDIDYVAVNRNPRANLLKKVGYALTFLDDSLLPATSNAVKRTNLRHRKMQKSIYRVRTRDHISQRIAADMQRDVYTNGLKKTIRTLHWSRNGGKRKAG